jgi:hypothetical protein
VNIEFDAKLYRDITAVNCCQAFYNTLFTPPRFRSRGFQPLVSDEFNQFSDVFEKLGLLISEVLSSGDAGRRTPRAETRGFSC